MKNELKEKLYKLMEESDYMDQDISGDVEVFVDLEFPGMYIKEILGDNCKIRKIWFEWCYDYLDVEVQENYLKEFNLI